MYRTYTDYINKTTLTVPGEFIDVKTGDTISVSSKVREQIEYHADNQTLIHLVLSALTNYLQPRRMNVGTKEILNELSEIKQLLHQGSFTNIPLSKTTTAPKKMMFDLKDVDDILEDFGG